MAYTQSDLEALKRAMAGGYRVVRYGDKTVEFRDVKDLERQIEIVEAELAATRPGFRRRRRTTVLVHGGKGLR